jgi:hypothetical protein
MNSYFVVKNNGNPKLIYKFKQIKDLTLESFIFIVHKDLCLYTPYNLKLCFSYDNTELWIVIPKVITVILEDYSDNVCEDAYDIMLSTINRWYRYNIQDRVSIYLEITHSYD